MSQQLQPSTAAIRAFDLPRSWLRSVVSAVRDGKNEVRALGEDRIEVYSERTKEWHPLSPVFVTAHDRNMVLLELSKPAMEAEALAKVAAILKAQGEAHKTILHLD